MEGVSLWLENKMSCLSLLSFIPSLFCLPFFLQWALLSQNARPQEAKVKP